MILVTGAAGYIGSCFLSKWRTALGIDSFIKSGKARDRIVVMDINDTANVTAFMKEHKITKVVNLAAVVGDPACIKYPKQAVASNLEGVKSLLKACADAGTVKKFVQASTCSVYGFNVNGDLTEESPLNPLSLYAELKIKAENAIRESGMPHAILRFSTAFGWSQSPRFDLTVNEFTREAVMGREIEVYRKDDWRPYAHISDLAGACYMATKMAGFAGTFNVGWARNNHTKQMIIDTISKYVPVPVKYVETPGADARNYKVNFDKLAGVMANPVFRTIDDGIIEIIKHLRKGEIDADDPAYRADHINS